MAPCPSIRRVLITRADYRAAGVQGEEGRTATEVAGWGTKKDRAIYIRHDSTNIKYQFTVQYPPVVTAALGNQAKVSPSSRGVTWCHVVQCAHAHAHWRDFTSTVVIISRQSASR